MMRNELYKSDIVVGTIIAGGIGWTALAYTVAAIQIAAGHFAVGGDLDGTYATGIPLVLAFGAVLVVVTFPASIAYVTWMLTHRYGSGSGFGSVVAALFSSFLVGFVFGLTVLFNTQEVPLAIACGVAFLTCVALVLLEVRSRPRDAQEAERA